MEAIATAGGRVYPGLEGVGIESEGERVTAVLTEAAARTKPHRFENYIVATGGILGGGIITREDGTAREVVFDLPVTLPASRQDWFEQDFMDPNGHPVYKAGVRIDEKFQPLNGSRQPVYENLYAAGTTLSHSEVIRERSFEGVALATGFAVGNLLAK